MVFALDSETVANRNVESPMQTDWSNPASMTGAWFTVMVSCAELRQSDDARGDGVKVYVVVVVLL